MDGWMDEWMDGWMGGWMDGWMEKLFFSDPSVSVHNFVNTEDGKLRYAVVKMELSDYILGCRSCTEGSGPELVVCGLSPYTLLPTPWQCVVWQDH
jgi:hypothetical protein